MVKLQDRFDFFIMLQLKQNKLQLEDVGCKKELIEPNF